MTDITLTLDEVRTLATQTLTENGCDAANADAVAAVITAAERDGCHSHGLMRLAGYVAALKSGKVNGHAAPTVEQLAASVVRVNGDSGFAPLALARGRNALIEAARKNGIAAMALVDIHHFAALSSFTLLPLSLSVNPSAPLSICEPFRHHLLESLMSTSLAALSLSLSLSLSRSLSKVLYVPHVSCCCSLVPFLAGVCADASRPRATPNRQGTLIRCLL